MKALFKGPKPTFDKGGGPSSAGRVCMQQKYASDQVEQPPAPAACPALSLAGTAGLVGTAVARPGSDCSERYSSLVHCGGHTLLFSRHEHREGIGIGTDVWTTTVRSLTGPAGFSAARVSLARPLNMSHNAVVRCLGDGRLVAYGGRKKERHARIILNERGVWRAEGRVATTAEGVAVAWQPPRLVLQGERSTGCVDVRIAVGQQCEFDGKLSVAEWRGETWLFARANLALCGGRGVQATRSADGVGGWSRWAPLVFEGVQTAAANNIYLFAAQPRAGRLVGVFPAVLGGRGGVWVSESRDGLHWSAPARMLRSVVYPEWRTADYPVDAPLRLSAQASAERRELDVFVEVGVRLEHGDDLAKCATPPQLCRYSVPAAALHAPATAPAPAPVALPMAPAATTAAGAGGVCKPTAAGGQPHALLLRGEVFRWGCTEQALELQQRAYASHVRRLIAPLEAHGHCFDVYALMSGDGGCGAAALRHAVHALGPSRLRGWTVERVAHQAEAMRKAVDFYAAASAPGGGHAQLYVSRHDVRLLSDVATWGGAAGQLRFASRCEGRAWASYRCVSDLLFVVPRKLLDPFSAGVGSHDGMSHNSDGQCGCFDPACPSSVGVLSNGLRRSNLISGHDCYNVMAKKVGSADLLGFVWRPIEQTVRATNPDYELPRCVEIDADAAYASRACMAGRKGMKGAMGKMPFSSKGGYRPIGLPTAKPLHARPGGLRRLRGRGRGFGGRARAPIK